MSRDGTKALPWRANSYRHFTQLRPRWQTLPSSHSSDVSDTGVGTAVEPESSAQCKSVAFSSAKLSPTQSRYNTFSRELLAIYLAIKHFQHLEGRHFSIFTDHKPLTTAMHNNSDKYTAHEFRHLDYISQFTTDLRYVKGENNTVADTLSRTELNTLDSDIFNQDLVADEQKSDSTLPGVLSDTSLTLQEYGFGFFVLMSYQPLRVI